MKTVEMEAATAPLAEYTKDVGEEPVIVTVNGKPVAALVPILNGDWEAGTLDADLKLVVRIQHPAEKSGVSSEDMRRRLRLCLTTCDEVE
jgi:prevent-host-death family protein